jgi:long-chain acyl-CoA synthetase
MNDSNHDIAKLPLPQQLLYWAKHRPHEVALRQKEFGVWQTITWSQYAQQARWFGLGLLQLGLKPNQSLAILSENCREWAIAQMGAALVRCVTSGVYPTSPAHEVEYLLTLSEAPIVLVEDQEQLDKVMEVRERLPLLKAIIIVDPRGIRRYEREALYDYEQIVALGQDFEKNNPQDAALRSQGPQMDDIGLVVFTSGSTGRPKAAMMSWRGLGTAAQGLNTVLQCRPSDDLVSYLPLCHVGEQMFSIHIPVARGAKVNFAESIRTIQEDLRELAPQIFFGVPRIWEKFHSSIQTKVREAGGLRYWLYQRAMHAMQANASTPASQWTLVQKLRAGFWRLVVLRALLNYVGLRKCRVAIASAAPIAPEILKFFRVLGVPIREAYGLTEASGATTMQASDASPIGTVGRPYPGVEVELAEDGEILIRGDVVFKGYFNNPEATREAIDDKGWLHTGDIGRWDTSVAATEPELRVVDRKKDMMITAGGKNITPSEIENVLRFSPYIKEAIIIADRRRFVACLIQINFDAVSTWAEEQGLTYTNFKNLSEQSAVQNLIQSEVDAVNAKMPQVQQVRKFHLLTKELDHDDGEVTATMKVRRSVITKKYHDVIESMYG